MPDFNKGDFTQQGVAGHVNANLRLNEKRLVNIDLTSNEEAEGCTITGTVTDKLNNKVYPIGAGVSGNIEITENGENINVAPYATATVNVAGGGGDVTETYHLIYAGEYEVEEETTSGHSDVYLFGDIVPQTMPDSFTLDIENTTVTFNKVSEKSYTSTDNKYSLNITSNNNIILTVLLSDFPIGSYIEIGEYTVTLTGHPNYLLIQASTLQQITVVGTLDGNTYTFGKNNRGESAIVFTVVSDYLLLGR